MPIRTLTATWTGQSGSAATATAVVTLDTDLVTTNPGGTIPVAQLQELTVTVQGAQAGNGTFGKADFSALSFYSSAPLDFSKELVGQPGAGDEPAYGTLKADGRAGDFNLIAQGASAAPINAFAFEIAANGGNSPSDILSIASIKP